MSEMDEYLTSRPDLVSISLKKFKKKNLPHIHVIGKHMSNVEMMRLYR